MTFAARAAHLCAAVAVTTSFVPSLVSSASAQDFTVIALPDTQNYSEQFPEIYEAQTQWIVDNRANRNIVAVTHLGDVVQNAAVQFEWLNAKQAHSTLDADDIPYGIAVGNHDIRYPGDFYDPAGVNFRTYFGPQFFTGKSWYRGASPSGLSNYQVVSVGGGLELLLMHILVETPPAELAWAQQILNENRDKPTIVSTHRYLFDWRVLGQGRYSDFNYTFEPPYRDDGITADAFFNSFVKPNDQIMMVLCGHNDGQYRQTSYHDDAQTLPVYEMLSDYQTTFGMGGNGWLRILRFAPDENLLYVDTFSPTLGTFFTDDAAKFTLPLDLSRYSFPAPRVTLQQGVDGYNGTQDTWIDEDRPNNSFGNSAVFEVDDDTTNNFFGSDRQGQGLVRWDGLIVPPVFEGDPEPTGIPQGSTILGAVATLTLEDDTDACNPDFYVHRMLRDWNESSTWNSLGSGIAIGSDADSFRIATFPGDNSPNSNFTRAFDMTSAVQQWANGAPNFGIAILPERVSFCDDGISIRSSENATAGSRPALTVDFSFDVFNRPPVIDQQLLASATMVNEGDSVTLTMAATDPSPLDPLVFTINDANVDFATGSGEVSTVSFIPDEGEYIFVGEVSDDEETVPAGAQIVIAINSPPTGGNCSFTPSSGTVLSTTFVFACNGWTDAGPNDLIFYAWDLNADGLFDDFAGPEGEIVFETPGEKAIRARIFDDDGGETFVDLSVSVAEAGPLPGDMNCDGVVNTVDIDAFVLALLDPAAYEVQFPNCSRFNADVNADGSVNSVDIDPFVELLLG